MTTKGKGKRTRRTTVEEEVEPQLPETDDEFRVIAEEDLPPGIENVLAEVGDEVARVVLYRRLKGERQAYVGTVDADEFTLDLVARMWGGGRYVARFSGTQGGFLKGKPGVTFYIDESIKPEPKRPAGVESGTGNGVTDTLMGKLLDRALAPPAPFDPAAVATAIATAASSQLAAMMGAISPLMAKLADLSVGGGGSKGSAAATDVLQAVELGLSLGGKDDGYLPVIKEVGVPLINALERMMAQREPRRALPPAAGPGAGSADVATPSEKPWVAAVRPYVQKIIGFARNGDEPSLWAAVLDRSFPKFAKWLEDAVQRPEFENELLLQFPELGPHQPWVHAFLAEFETEDAPPEAHSVDGSTEDGDGV